MSLAFVNYTNIASYIPSIYLRELIKQKVPTESLPEHVQKFLYPLEGIKLSNKYSLTDTIDIENKIRFNLKKRTLRLAPIIAKIFYMSGFRKLSINYFLINNEFIRYFITSCTKFGIQISLNQNIENLHLTNNEKDLVSLILSNNLDNKHKIVKYIYKYSHAQDVYTASYLIDHLSDTVGYNHESLKNNLRFFGFTKASVDSYATANYLYNLALNKSNLNETISTYYNLAMLYLRHNNHFIINIKKGKQYLNKGLTLLKKNKQNIDSEDYLFYNIFNRNGYALVQSKEGNLKQAEKFLLKFSKLLNLNNTKHHMHMTVLLYNLAQIYTLQKNYVEAIEAYNQLISIDSNYPEYYNELALVLIKNNNISEAKSVLLIALQKDEYYADGLYNLSIIEQNEELKVKYSKQAYENSYDDVYLYNYLYNLASTNSNHLLLMNNFEFNSTYLKEYVILLAELYLSVNNIAQAKLLLNEASVVWTEDTNIKNNIAMLNNAS